MHGRAVVFIEYQYVGHHVQISGSTRVKKSRDIDSDELKPSVDTNGRELDGPRDYDLLCS